MFLKWSARLRTDTRDETMRADHVEQNIRFKIAGKFESIKDFFFCQQRIMAHLRDEQKHRIELKIAVLFGAWINFNQMIKYFYQKAIEDILTKRSDHAHL